MKDTKNFHSKCFRTVRILRVGLKANHLATIVEVDFGMHALVQAPSLQKILNYILNGLSDT
jgi:hypothetical protein